MESLYHQPFEDADVRRFYIILTYSGLSLFDLGITPTEVAEKPREMIALLIKKLGLVQTNDEACKLVKSMN